MITSQKMKIKYLVFFLMLLVLGCTQKERIADSFWTKYDQSDWDSSKKEKVLDSLYLQFTSQSNDSATRYALFRLAARYERLNLNDKYYRTTKKASQWAIAKNDTLDIAKSLWYIGDFHDNEQVFDSAFHYYSQSEKFYRLSKKDSLNWGRMLLYKTRALYKIGIYTESEVETVKTLQVFSKINASRLHYEATLQMALLLGELKEYEEAMKYHQITLKQLNALKGETKESLNLSYIIHHNNVGSLYNKMHDYRNAKEYLEKGLAFSGLDRDPLTHAMLLNNYAYSKMQLGENHQVDSLLSLSLRLRDSIGHKQGIIASKLNIGEYFLQQKDTLQAISYVDKAYTLSVDAKSHFDILRSLELLAESDLPNQAYHTQRLLTVKDSIREIERATKDKFARIAYETEQVNLENEVLVKRNTILLFLFAGAIGLIVFTIVAYRYRLKNRNLRHKQKELQSAQKIYELLFNERKREKEIQLKERKRISRELHDGVVNRVFTTRFNLQRLESTDQELKNSLLAELKKTENHIRQVSHDLREHLFFENQDFNRLLKELVAQQVNEFGTEFILHIDPKIAWSKITNENKIHVYRILQESLHNINKYAQATKSHIILMRQESNIILRIHDNGIGFNPKRVRKGLGFRIIKERTEELQGNLRIVSEKNKNTFVEVTFPWRKKNSSK